MARAEIERYKGPTAAESSLWHFVDISLGVSHDDEFLLVYLNIREWGHRIRSCRLQF